MKSRLIYLLLLLLMAISLTTSKFMMNLVWVLMLVNWASQGHWQHKWMRIKNNKMLHAFLLLMGVHVLWLLASDNWAYGLDDIRKKLPLLAVPLVILSSKPLSHRHRRWVFATYVTTVLVVSFIGLVRYLTIPDLPYRQIVPFISHIRFALNVCLTIVVLIYGALQLRRRATAPKSTLQQMKLSLWLTPLMLVCATWLAAFLFLIQSYTAIIILAIVAVTLLFAYWREAYPRSLVWLLVLLAVGGTGAGLCIHYGKQYYQLDQRSTLTPYETFTPSGNRYEHADDGLIENGSYVNNYVCPDELRQQWAKVSAHPADDLTPNGYSIYKTLVRYLNGKGLAKDSTGVAQLNSADIAAIEKGIANPVYLSRNKVKKMVYVMLFEYESAQHLHSVKDFTMLQRFELWKNGLEVFLRGPIIGTGTGDVADDCQANLARHGSELAGSGKHTHNQYLTFLISFGLLGFLIIGYGFVRALAQQRKQVIAIAFLCIVWVSCISEDTLETLAGCMFVAYFGSLLYQVVPDLRVKN